MNLFKQIVDDFKAAAKAQQIDQSAVEPMPKSINTRPYASASHILLGSQPEAEDLLSRITQGELTFEEAAEQYSICPSRKKAGNLGTFKSLGRILYLPYESKWQSVAPFDEVVFGNSVDLFVVESVTTDFGTHLVKVTARNVKV